MFEIVDTGSGFDADGEAVMFKPFSQVDGSVSYGYRYVYFLCHQKYILTLLSRPLSLICSPLENMVEVALALSSLVNSANFMVVVSLAQVVRAKDQLST
jgi:hypothetical protein